jgi:predicted TIM-barrel fold metal-dependent hydrolase
MPIFDFQTQILPDRLSRSLPEAARKWGKFWSKPVSRTLHEIHPWTRFLPTVGRVLIEEIGALAPLTHMAFESSLEDLIESMEENQIDRSLILSDPARISNEQLIGFAEIDPRLVAAIRIPLAHNEPRVEIEAAHARGVRVLQIHPSADGLEPSHPSYEAQLSAAADRGWIILLQTGSPKAHLVYRRPEASSVERFAPWFEKYPKTPFVLARMNFSDPGPAMEIAETRENVYLETSWQPAETIAEAVRRLGADRIVFGSDWPILGNNQRVGLSRIRDARDSQMISEAEAELILGENAERLLAAAKR